MKDIKTALKPYKIFKEVFMDIDETPRSEEEESSERDRVTAARKRVLGDNYIFPLLGVAQDFFTLLIVILERNITP